MIEQGLRICELELQQAAIFSAASGGATSPEQAKEILARKDVAYSSAPRGTMALAAFLQKIGLLTSLPADW